MQDKVVIDNLLQKFSQSTVLVIGDVMVDAYLNGSVGRISPEAPVPIVDIQERTYRAGGAANVAINLQSLGAQPILCSVIGNDAKGELLQEILQKNHLKTDYLIPSTFRKTTIKYRVIGNQRQMLRIDEEDLFPLKKEEAADFLQTVKQIIDNQKVDAIVFEDYDKGVLSKSVIQTIVGWAKAQNIIVTVDPKRKNFSHYQGVTLFKPNLKELKEGLQDEDKTFSIETVQQLMRDFATEHQIDYLFTTLSEKGVAMYDRQEDSFFTEPAYLRKISDVSGAGDSVIATATLCLLAGLPIHKVAQVANLAGGIVCEYSGVTPVHQQQLMDEIRKYNIV